MGCMVCGSNPDKGKIYLSSPKSPDWLWGPASHNSRGTGVLSREQSGRGIKLSIPLHLEPRLRMSGVIPLLSLYAFMEGIGKTLSFFNSSKATATTDRKNTNKYVFLKMWKKEPMRGRKM